MVPYIQLAPRKKSISVALSKVDNVIRKVIGCLQYAFARVIKFKIETGDVERIS